MLAFWTRGFPCQNTGKENLWCPERVDLPIGVQKGGSQYSPAIVVYTLHSIIMVLLYYIYLLDTYHWLLSLILSVHFRNWMHLT